MSFKVLLHIGIPDLGIDYGGPDIFENILCSESTVKKLIEFIEIHREDEFVYNINTKTYHCCYGELRLQIIDDDTIVNAYPFIEEFISSERLIEWLGEQAEINGFGEEWKSIFVDEN